LKPKKYGIIPHYSKFKNNCLKDRIITDQVEDAWPASIKPIYAQKPTDAKSKDFAEIGTRI
jgi:hypothetical protein